MGDRFLEDAVDDATTDFRNFAGRRAGAFLPAWLALRADGRQGGRLPISWCWPAVLFGAAWFFYRKLYPWGAAALLLPLLLGYIAGPRLWLLPALGLGLAQALLAKGLYARAAARGIAAADRAGLSGGDRVALLRRRGGVSPAALALCLVIYPGLLVVNDLLAQLGLHPHPPIAPPVAAPTGLPLLILILLAIAPALLLLAYGVLRCHGRWRDETLWSVFLVGGVVALDTAVVEIVLGALPLPRGLPPQTADAVRLALAAGIVEEVAKFLVLMLVAERQLGPRRPQDWPLLGLAVGLGFAALENIFAVAGSADGVAMAAARALTAVPTHAGLGMIMGALLAAAWRPTARRRLLTMLALVLPMLLHVVYDFAVLAGDLAGATGWPVPVFLTCLAAASLLGVELFSRALTASGTSFARSRHDLRLPVLLGLVMVLGGLAPLAVALLWLAGLLPDNGVTPDTVNDSLAFIAASLFPLAAGIDLLRDAARRPRGGNATLAAGGPAAAD